MGHRKWLSAGPRPGRAAPARDERIGIARCLDQGLRPCRRSDEGSLAYQARENDMPKCDALQCWSTSEDWAEKIDDAIVTISSEEGKLYHHV